MRQFVAFVFIFIFNDKLSKILNGKQDYKLKQGQTQPPRTLKQVRF
jgi:hypothetical protein